MFSLGGSAAQLPEWASQVREENPSFDWIPWVSGQYCDLPNDFDLCSFDYIDLGLPSIQVPQPALLSNPDRWTTPSDSTTIPRPASPSTIDPSLLSIQVPQPALLFSPDRGTTPSDDAARSRPASPVTQSPPRRQQKRPHSEAATATQIPGYRKFNDWVRPQNSGGNLPLTGEAKAKIRDVKERGACLRCRSQKKSCDSLDPCSNCRIALLGVIKRNVSVGKWHWESCIRPSLVDKNVFRYCILGNLTTELNIVSSEPLPAQRIPGIENSRNGMLPAHLLSPSPDLLDILDGMPLGDGITTPKEYLDKALYRYILEHALTHDAVEARCFVTTVPSPLYLFLEANTVLMYGGIIRDRLQGRLDRIKRLRASASAVVFSQLERLLGRNEISRIKKAGPTSCADVITVLGLILEAVLDYGDQPAVPLSAQPQDLGGQRDTTRETLEQLLCFYIYDLSTAAFPSSVSFLHTFGMKDGRAFIDFDFWDEFLHARLQQLQGQAQVLKVTAPRPKPDDPLGHWLQIPKLRKPKPLAPSDPRFIKVAEAFLASGPHSTAMAIRHMYLQSLCGALPSESEMLRESSARKLGFLDKLDGRVDATLAFLEAELTGFEKQFLCEE
ncbi:hypothetical protein QBC47DRAFT_414921 [Echria macrotheca]|uniref:Zn(2)-C6 fungal-type domain-containing protein n=1 Tax=Echria macrotheca TaxID=438768 RepID=A0AAJ0F3Y7_9PEZI|nr:hypothetical protein QBC47DRAFT_414921 [Echria macrotheca]